MARVIPNCSKFLHPLNRSTAGKTSQQKVDWTPALTSAFDKAQQHLCSNKSVVLPKHDDQLWIVTDGATSNGGIAATLYAVRNNKPRAE